MKSITSRKNPIIKKIRKLHQKKYRDNYSLFIMEGLRCLSEVLNYKVEIDTLIHSEDIKDDAERLLKKLSPYAGYTHKVSGDIMQYLSPANTSQGLLAVIPKMNHSLEDVTSEKKGFQYYTALFNVSDPGNLGTVIRTARAFSAGAVFTVGQCVDPYNPRTVRATAGHILGTAVFTFESLDRLLNFCSSKGFPVAALDPAAKKTYTGELKNGTVILFGGEAHGLDAGFKNSLQTFRLPTDSSVESLNLSICAGIIMEKVYSKNIWE